MQRSVDAMIDAMVDAMVDTMVDAVVDPMVEKPSHRSKMFWPKSAVPYRGTHVVMLRLGRRLVNLLPVAQPTNALDTHPALSFLCRPA